MRIGRAAMLSMTVAAGLGVTCAAALWSAPASAAGSCKAPRVLVILDKSSSMLGEVGGKSKWQIAKDALSTVLNKHQANIEFGLMVFPDPKQCGPGAVKVKIGPLTAQAIMSKLATPPPDAGNWTPMAQSLDVAPSVKELQDAGYSKHVLLITDGWQWCSPYSATTRFLPVNSVASLEALGIKTHVVGFGDGVDALTLNKMAAAAKNTTSPTCNVAGSDATAANNCYYQANNPQQLLAALQKITSTITQEVCDGLDNDCKGGVDDGLTAPACINQQGVCQGATRSCGGVAGWSACGPAEYAGAAAGRGQTYQAEETACDGQDNDCDGATDEGCGTCEPGQSQACGGTGGCKGGVQKCVDGQWGPCEGATTPGPEVCDGLDNDCNNQIDEGVTRPCSTICGAGIESCNGGAWGGCTAPKPSTEICDGLDNDCDGVVDGERAACNNGQTCIAGVCKEPSAPINTSSGCDCRIGAPSGASLLGVLGLLLLLLWDRRRR